jgi:hypothetical protein
MRKISREWPGALREAELVHPDRIQVRAESAHGCDPRLPREALIERGELGWLLTTELHRRLRSLNSMRTRARTSNEPWDYASEIERLDSSERELWPSGDSQAALHTLRASVRLAYLGLAWCCGVSLPLLNALIFERQGSWDAREGDPVWASEPGPREQALARVVTDMR